MQAADPAALLLLFTPCANSNCTVRNFQFRKFLPVYSNDLFAEGWEKLTK